MLTITNNSQLNSSYRSGGNYENLYSGRILFNTLQILDSHGCLRLQSYSPLPRTKFLKLRGAYFLVGTYRIVLHAAFLDCKRREFKQHFCSSHLLILRIGLQTGSADDIWLVQMLEMYMQTITSSKSKRLGAGNA